MIKLTDRAAEQIKTLVPEAERSEKGLRIFVENGGCSGMQYVMKIDASQEKDEIIENNDAKLLIDPQSISYLKDSTIDFEDGLTNTGFRIQNPNAKQTCGCGTSFEA